jgi:hypothetical protein
MNQFFEKLQIVTRSKIACNNKRCKDKWNCLNNDYKKIVNYHKGTYHNTSNWEMSVENNKMFHLSMLFNEECYNAIKFFQGKRNVNTSMYV